MVDVPGRRLGRVLGNAAQCSTQGAGTWHAMSLLQTVQAGRHLDHAAWLVQGSSLQHRGCSSRAAPHFAHWCCPSLQALDVFSHLDCAEAYGTEREVGIALKEHLSASSKQREDVFITTKVFRSLPNVRQASVFISKFLPGSSNQWGPDEVTHQVLPKRQVGNYCELWQA